MKVVHLNFSDSFGGAAIAAFRHHEAMNNVGIDSKMLVVKKKTDLKNIFSILNPTNTSKYTFHIKNKFEKVITRLFIKTTGMFSLNYWGLNVYNHPAIFEADIIYIHWICNSFLSISEIERILKLNKPVYWYMHDMYAITGGCHHSFECNKYQLSCDKCSLQSKILPIDLVGLQFKKKINAWSKYSNFKIITPSKWLNELVCKSTIFKGHETIICPNILDTNTFKPIPKQQARKKIGINTSKKILLFGAVDINSIYKGWDFLKNALNKLDDQKYECLVFGIGNKMLTNDIKLNIKFTGYVNNNEKIINIYNAADVFISSSLADNYPNVILEAMACGIPCVGFNIGGIPDLILHKERGYLSKYKDSNDLANGINWILENESRYNILSNNCIEFVDKNGSYKQVLNLHKELNI